MSEENVNILCQDLWEVFRPRHESVSTPVNNGVIKKEVLEQNTEGACEPWTI